MCYVGALYAYYDFDFNDPLARIYISLGLATTGHKLNEEIRDYLKDLEQGECQEVLGLDFKKMTRKDYWLKGRNHSLNREPLENMAIDDFGVNYEFDGKRISNTAEIAEMIVDSIDEMISLLEEAQKKTMNAPKALFGDFFHKMEGRMNEKQVASEYEEWIMKTENLSFDSLKEYQTLVVAEFLKKRILRYTTEPSKKALDQVRLDLVQDYLPIGYELTSEFAISCARFRRFISWDDDILQINYDAYGKYLFQHYYQLSEQERDDMMRLDLLLKMIHRDMAQLRPELAAYLKANTVAENSKNYFAVGKNLSVMLEGDWFKAFRTDKKYDREWIIKFMSALMKSEYRDMIAEEWQKADKRLSIKANIIGCMKDAGVIQGSDMSIAKSVVNGTERENKTFATYIGKGKKCEYNEWIKRYVKNG